MKNIFIDIETFGGLKPSIDELKVPGTMSKPETIAKWKEENLEECWKKQALDSMKGQIVCIGVAIDDKEVKTFTDLKSEENLLKEFVAYILSESVDHDLSTCSWIAHNGNTFDFVWLFHRIKKYGLMNPMPVQRNSQFIDTMRMAGFTDYKAMYSLKNLCAFFGIGIKEGTGKDVHELVCLEFDKELSEYCAQDVELLRRLYLILK